MKKPQRRDPDFALILAILLLLSMGLIMVFSASYVIAGESRGDPYYFLRRQALWVGLGLAGMFILSRFPYWRYRRLSLFVLLANFVLLTLVFTPLGTDLGTDARRWLSIGGLTVQPAEFSKLAFILFTAAYLSSRSVRLENFWSSSFIPLVLVGINFIFVAAQPDVGTALVLVAGTMVIILLAGMPIKHLAALVLLALPPLLAIIFKAEYRIRRLMAFLDPWADPSGTGYQIIQSLLALGPGHLFGVGLGRSRQKLYYLPEPQNDFIFAVIGEELGFVGAAAVLLLFFVLIWRGLKIAMAAPDTFGSLLAAGITAMIAIQALTNIAVVTGSIPVTEITLPLISAGGSSVFITLCSLGVLLNISRYAQK